MVICADDFGLSEDIDRAIVELCGRGKLSAVSCMVALERCTPAALRHLLAHQSMIDVGLHLCLTEVGLPFSSPRGKGATSGPLPGYGLLVRRALAGRIEAGQVALEVSGQYGLFLEKCGRRPDFIDGHLHAHQLPGARRGVLEFVLSLPVASRPYIRNTRMGLRKLWQLRLPVLKSALIGLFGARMFRELKAAGLPTNQGFAGIYDFRHWRRYAEYLPRFVACLPDPTGLLVAHPGQEEEWRRQEFAVLWDYPFPPGALNRFSLASGNPARARDQ